MIIFTQFCFLFVSSIICLACSDQSFGTLLTSFWTFSLRFFCLDVLDVTIVIPCPLSLLLAYGQMMCGVDDFFGIGHSDWIIVRSTEIIIKESFELNCSSYSDQIYNINQIYNIKLFVHPSFHIHCSSSDANVYSFLSHSSHSSSFIAHWMVHSFFNRMIEIEWSNEIEWIVMIERYDDAMKR